MSSDVSPLGPYAAGGITDKVYVLKETDRWDPDADQHGLIWSGAMGKYKTDQHSHRFILSPDGTVLRGPIAPVPRLAGSPPVGTDRAGAPDTHPEA